MTVSDKIARSAPAPPTAWPRWFCGNIGAALATLIRPPRAAWSWRAPKTMIGIAVAALLVLLLIAFVDQPAIVAARTIPPWLRNIVEFVTVRGESQVFLVPLGMMLILIAATASPALNAGTRSLLAATSIRLGYLFLAIAVPGLFSTVAKHVIARRRPTMTGVIDPLAFGHMDWHWIYASMPSGHATTAFAAAVAFGTIWPRLRPLVWAYAVAIALSRVAIAAHYPSDAVAGAAVGCIGALLVRRWFATRGLGFCVAPDGHVVTLPGPKLAHFKRLARRCCGG